MIGLCSECKIKPAPVLFIHEHCPVINFFTRQIIAPYARIEYRRCLECEAKAAIVQSDYADLVEAGRPIMLRAA